jgi:hypothetical protein
MASTMGEHNGWKIRVGPREEGEAWYALIEVWPPGVESRQTSALIVPFHRHADSRQAIVDLGLEAARRYIQDHG